MSVFPVQLGAIDTSQTAIDSQLVALNAIKDEDGTERLCVSFGIPKQGQVTSFRTVQITTVMGEQDVYQCPQGKTFYIFNITVVSNDNTPNDIVLSAFTIGNVRFDNAVLAGSGAVAISNIFPVAICQQGEVIHNILSGTPAGHRNVITISGYEVFGTTT